MNELAKVMIKSEAESLDLLAKNIPSDFSKLVNRIVSLNGRLIISGIGKSGYIARKIAASFASTGTPAFYINPAEASHGDLGMITENDIVILLSNSGETKEIFDIINYCKRFSIEIAAMTMMNDSTLATACDYLLNIPLTKESSKVSAPTTSALMMLALGDALMMSVYEQRGFTVDDFKIYHPGGKIGAKLLKAADLMHRGPDLPVVLRSTKATDVIIAVTKYRLGCVVVMEDAEVIGIITDGDLTRHMSEDIVKLSAADLMTSSPKCISSDTFASEALARMNKSSITCLLVVDSGKLQGILHIHDILKAGVE
ncbi:MAG: KpsF/GutQ family sugar-phosphate isomerase [Rickettsiaceae bacterium]|nr:KpsF/GutQ family sugar-phosphate isomerase [Rickettsiaceae bacterium]